MEYSKGLIKEMGNIISYKLLLDQNNKSRGIAFCKYDTNEEAKKAIEALNGTIPNLIKAQLQYKKKYTYFTVSIHNQLKHYFILIKFKALLLRWSWCLEISWTVHIINYIIISVNILISYLIFN